MTLGTPSARTLSQFLSGHAGTEGNAQRLGQGYKLDRGSENGDGGQGIVLLAQCDDDVCENRQDGLQLRQAADEAWLEGAERGSVL